MAARTKHALFILFIAILLLCFFEAAYAQTPEDEMIKLLGGKNWSEASSVEKTNDGGYIIVGTINSDGIGSENLWLVKTDSKGVTKWEKPLGISRSIGRFILRTDDDKYLIAAITELKNNTNLDAWIIKTDSAGNIDKNPTVVGGPGRDQVFSILETKDKSYTVIGSTESPKKDSEIWLIKLSNDGSQIWNRSINLIGNETGRSAVQMENGSYLIAGYSISPTDGQPEALLISADSEGRLNNKTIIKNSIREEIGLDKAYSLLKVKDGYILLGASESITSDEKKILLAKFFDNGIKNWSNISEGAGLNVARSVIETEDGSGYIIVGETNSNDHGSLDALITKINSKGSKVWTRALGGAGYDIGNSVLQTDDGGFLIAGATGSYGNRTLNGWLVKVNSTGYEEWNTTLGLPASLIAKKTIFERFNDTAVDLNQRYIEPFSNALFLIPIKLLLFLIGFYLLYKMLMILISIYRKRELVIEDFINASAEDSLKDVLTGLREEMTEKIIKKTESIERLLTTHKEDLGPENSKGRPEFIYSPKESQISSVKEMADSLKELAPDKVKPLMALIAVIFPKRQGVKISCSLQGHKDQSDTLGITVRLTENRDSEMTVVQTFWEQELKPGVAKTNYDKSDKVQPLRTIARNLCEAGQYADAVKYQKEAFDLDSSREKNLSKYYDKQKEMELRRLYYNKARKYQELEKIAKAKENYSKSLSLYVFKWYGIPGKDNERRLIDFLTQKFGIDWVKTAEVKKTDDKTIKVYTKEKFLLLKLNDNKTEVVLEIDGNRTTKFEAKLENDVLSIYKDQYPSNSDFREEKIPYFELAKLYKDVGMFDEAIDLFKLASIKQYKGEKDLERIKRAKAHHLLEAGKILRQEARDSEASIYLEAASNLSPQDQTIKNTLEQVKTAIQKQKKPYVRFKDLMDRASFWSTVEVVKWAMLDATPRRYRIPLISTAAHKLSIIGSAQEYRAEVHLFCGILKLSYATAWGYSEFYQLAKMDFNKAKNYCTSWYRPYSYLGDTYAFEARISTERTKLAREAILNYNEALKMLDGKNPIEKKSNPLNSKDYLAINLSIACLLAGDTSKAKIMQRKTILENYLNGRDVAYLQEYPLKGKNSARTLYNYACLFGLIKIFLKDKNCQELQADYDTVEYAKKLIIYSMARDRYKDILKIVDNDSDLKEIFSSPEEIDEIKFEVQSKRIDNPELYKCEKDVLDNKLSKILSKYSRSPVVESREPSVSEPKRPKD